MAFIALRGMRRACVSTRENQKSTRNTLLQAGDRPRLKAIPTRYDGYYFRSLTEARYAVLWNTCYLPYEFERQGFALERGAYRPDFYFPNHAAWVEVKGPPATLREEDLCQILPWNLDNRSLSLGISQVWELSLYSSAQTARGY
jgi:hypothetical protein